MELKRYFGQQKSLATIKKLGRRTLHTLDIPEEQDHRPQKGRDPKELELSPANKKLPDYSEKSNA